MSINLRQLLILLLLPRRRLAALLWRWVAESSSASLQGDGLGQPSLLAQLQLQILQDKGTDQSTLVCLYTQEGQEESLSHSKTYFCDIVTADRRYRV